MMMLSYIRTFVRKMEKCWRVWCKDERNRDKTLHSHITFDNENSHICLPLALCFNLLEGAVLL